MPQQDRSTKFEKMLQEEVGPGLAYWMGRIDTKMDNLVAEVHKAVEGFVSKVEFGNTKADMAEIKQDLKDHLIDVETLKTLYVTQVEFKVVKAITYGLVTLILIGFMGAVVRFFIVGA